MHKCRNCGRCSMEEKVLADAIRVDEKPVRYMDLIETKRKVFPNMSVNKSLLGKTLSIYRWQEDTWYYVHFSEPKKPPLVYARY